MSSEEMQRDLHPERPRQVQQIVENHRECNDQRLACLAAVDACKDVDAIRAEGGQQRHVEVVQRSEVHEQAEDGSQRERDDNGRGATLGVVNEQEGDRSDQRDGKLVSPANVKDVVEEAEKCCNKEREN